MPDPDDDTVLQPLWLRSSKSPASQVEMMLVVFAAAVAPVGWLGGWILKRRVSGLIPATLRGYPVAALLWSGAGLGLLIIVAYQVAYEPAGSLGQIVVLPWGCVQLAAVPVVAGIYGSPKKGGLRCRIGAVVAVDAAEEAVDGAGRR